MAGLLEATGFEIDDHPFHLSLPAIILILILTYFRRGSAVLAAAKAKPPFVNRTRGPVTCPWCHAPWPGGYVPLSRKEHMWKGVVCPDCGCEYGDRGRERKE